MVAIGLGTGRRSVLSGLTAAVPIGVRVPDLPVQTMALIAGAFLLAGLIKGVVGLGLPTVSLALLTATLGVKYAIALMLVPSLVTNVWQALAGGALVSIVKRTWTLLTMACIGIWFGAKLLANADAELVGAAFGLLLCVYCIFSLATPQIPAPGRREVWLSPLVGTIAGVITGLTGSFVVPGILYLQALGLSRDVLVQTMGVTFVVLTVALGSALSSQGLLSSELGIVSAAAVVPAALGMVFGQKVRKRLPEATFRRVFFFALLALGVYIFLRALF